ncbi:rRNA-processing protein las1 [Gryganskiella cystojenkinii]|nr:rRNA-processing protein las1 [Gryganskiella cystojenkinii]
MPPPKLPKLVPWHSPAEFIQVHEWFYSEPNEDGTPDIRAQECALRRVKAWEARGKLPHAIDSTASFVQVVSRDWTGMLTDQELRLMYSMVFIRFVNGFVDAFQSKNSAKSIAYLAVAKVGMPVWFVELRHTATHDYLPSLTILRSATNQALAWLNEEYWLKQLVSIRLDEKPSPEMLAKMAEDTRRLIETFRNTREQQIEENTLWQSKQDFKTVDRLVRDLIKSCQSGDRLFAAMIPILLEPGMLIPKSKKSRASSRDLSLRNLGRIVDLCWLPFMNHLHKVIGRNTILDEEGEEVEISFWSSLLNGMLGKLFEANEAAKAVAEFRATDEQKEAAKTGSYLITILAWIKYLIKLHYDQEALRPPKPDTTHESGANSPSLSSLSVNSPTAASTASFASRIAKQLAEQKAAVATEDQAEPMFDQDEIVDIVQDCLDNSMVHVSPLVRSVLNTVIEADAKVKESIAPILKLIDQRIVSASGSAVAVTASATTTATPAAFSSPTVGSKGGVWQEGPALESLQQQQASQGEDTNMDTSLPDHDQHPDASAMEVVKAEETESSSPSMTVPASSWTLFDPDEWRPCPLGSLPGGIVPDLSLPWDLDPPPIARLQV